MTLLGCSFQNFRRAFPYFIVPLIWPRNAIQRINRSPVGKCYRTNRAIHCIVTGPVVSVIHVSNNVTRVWCCGYCFVFLTVSWFPSNQNHQPTNPRQTQRVLLARALLQRYGFWITRVTEHGRLVTNTNLLQNMPCKHTLAAYQEDFDHTIVQ